MTTVDDRPARITPVLKLPVPGDEGPADAPADIGALADALDSHAAAGQFGWQPGDLKMTAAQAAPTGWLLCQGQAVDRTIYSGLFAAIGTAYGAGDGATTFNLPNLQDMMPLGASGARPRGTRGGAPTVVLTAAQSGVNGNGGTGWQSADHAHYTSGGTDVDQPDHSHGIGGWNAGVPGGTAQTVSGMGAPAFVWATTGRNVYHTHGFAAWSGGVSANHAHAFNARDADAAHENLPPFVAVNMMIKT